MAFLRSRSKFGKYIIERKLGEGGFAVVYQARDTIEGVRVALKIPYSHVVTDSTLESFRKEVRLAAQLQHPHILPLKYADFIDGRFVIVTELGLGTLEERLAKRLSVQTALDFASQMIDAVAFAHANKIIHCDVKPENLLLFPDDQLRLTDFGIARVAHKTLNGSGAGTVGYIAPEQAMGKPSFRSDVFSLGLVVYRMLAGQLPEWPYQWPFPGGDRLKKKVNHELIEVLKKATQVNARSRYQDAQKMSAAFERAKLRRKQAMRTADIVARSSSLHRDWRSIRFKDFQREFGKVLETCHACEKCGGPVSEVMKACPWCGKSRSKHTQPEVRFSVACPRCYRGLKADWEYCAWCFGRGFEPSTSRKLSDRRYSARCPNERCKRKDLMPFMCYCPWCKSRLKKKWKLEGSSQSCKHCGWGITKDYWNHCPWCAKRIQD